jgi:hypothetical protein
MTPEEEAKAEQSLAYLADVLPAHWYRIYKNSIEVGFTKAQAFKIILTIVSETFAKKSTENYDEEEEDKDKND